MVSDSEVMVMQDESLTKGLATQGYGVSTALEKDTRRWTAS